MIGSDVEGKIVITNYASTTRSSDPDGYDECYVCEEPAFISIEQRRWGEDDKRVLACADLCQRCFWEHLFHHGDVQRLEKVEEEYRKKKEE